MTYRVDENQARGLVYQNPDGTYSVNFSDVNHPPPNWRLLGPMAPPNRKFASPDEAAQFATTVEFDNAGSDHKDDYATYAKMAGGLGLAAVGIPALAGALGGAGAGAGLGTAGLDATGIGAVDTGFTGGLTAGTGLNAGSQLASLGTTVGGGLNLAGNIPAILKGVSTIAGGVLGNSSGGAGGSFDPNSQMALNRNVRDLNLTDYTGPGGSTRNTIDPVTGRVTQNTELSPDLQQQFDSANAGINSSIGQMTPFDPNAYNNPGSTGGNDPFAYSSQLQQGMGKYGSGDPSYNQDRKHIEQALLSRYTPRLDKRFAQDETALRDRLANQGATAGGAYYNREIGNFGQTKSDAYRDILTEAILQGGQEQSRLAGLDNQTFNQNLASGNFGLNAQQQRFTQGLIGHQQPLADASGLANLRGAIPQPNATAPPMIPGPDMAAAQRQAQLEALTRYGNVQTGLKLPGELYDIYKDWNK